MGENTRHFCNEPLYTATDVGNFYSITKNMVGRLATRYNLRIEKYGKFVIESIPYGNRGILKKRNFWYNQEGVKFIGKILNKPVPKF